MPRPVRQQQLLDIAEEMFATRGYEDTSIEDIARAAGVSRPIVYEHHGSKEGLYLACVRRARHALEQAMAAAASEDPIEEITHAADAYFRVLERDPRRWELLFGPTGPVVGALGEELTRQRFGTVKLIAARIAAHVPDAGPQRIEAFAHAASGAAEQLGRWWLANPGLGRHQVVAHYRDVIWAGLSQLLPESNRGG